MFTENHLAIRFDEALARSSTAAFQELQDVVGARLPATCGEAEAKRVATAIWAGLHGTALLASGRLIPVGGPRDEGRAEAEGDGNRPIVDRAILRRQRTGDVGPCLTR